MCIARYRHGTENHQPMKTTLAVVTGVAFGLYLSDVWFSILPDHPNEVLLVAVLVGIAALAYTARKNGGSDRTEG